MGDPHMTPGTGNRERRLQSPGPAVPREEGCGPRTGSGPSPVTMAAVSCVCASCPRSCSSTRFPGRAATVAGLHTHGSLLPHSWERLLAPGTQWAIKIQVAPCQGSQSCPGRLAHRLAFFPGSFVLAGCTPQSAMPSSWWPWAWGFVFFWRVF